MITTLQSGKRLLTLESIGSFHAVNNYGNHPYSHTNVDWNAVPPKDYHHNNSYTLPEY